MNVSFHLLELRFRVLKPVNDLPHFHGAQWSALLRHLLRPHLPGGSSLADGGILLQSVETGFTAYQVGDPIHLGLAVPAPLFPAVRAMLARFTTSPATSGHFQPGVTIALEHAVCRICGGDCFETPCLLDHDHLAEEIDLLRQRDQFSLELISPLRIPRPGGAKDGGHAFLDQAYLFGSDRSAPLERLAAKIRLHEEETGIETLTIVGGAVTWLDLPYGGKDGKTLGGVVGTLRIAGRPSTSLARRLVLGQYLGTGKNGAFGFGGYTIPELAETAKVLPLTRGRTLLNRAATVESLRGALSRLPNSSPGPDGLTTGDLTRAGDPFLERLAGGFRDGECLDGGSRRYHLPKKDGTFRTIHVHNVTERLLHRSVSDTLTPAIDRLLSSSAYAFRRGLNRKNAATALRRLLAEGYTTGIKADIAAFFDSVDTTGLGDLLAGLFPAEPLTALIRQWLERFAAAGIPGLPQGWVLSPLLSNLFLDRFDREMEREGFRLVRYADDFVALSRENQGGDAGMGIIEAALGRLGLRLHPDKTEPLCSGTPLRFLGYLVSAEGIGDQVQENPDDAAAGPWLPLFRDVWCKGAPVYLTSLCRGAWSSGPHLVIRQTDDHTESTPWGAIGRLVVVGRSSFSGGVVYRAMKEAIPVSFIDVMGQTTGHLYSAAGEEPEIVQIQRRHASDPEACLDFSRRIIVAKIQNSADLLRRNDRPLPELKEMAAKAAFADNADSLRGYEGNAARLYFAALSELTAPFEFRSRIYHPPDGPVNVMLSFGYTLIYNRLASVLTDKGFNPRIGFFHQGRGTHAALASDLQEELRFLAERIVLALIHRHEITPESFTDAIIHGKPSCRMSGDGFRAFIHRYEKTMSSVFTWQGRKISYNAYLDEMADNLKRSLKLGIPYEPLRAG